MTENPTSGLEGVNIESIVRYARDHFGNFYVVKPTEVNGSGKVTMFPHYQELTRPLKESEDEKPTL